MKKFFITLCAMMAVCLAGFSSHAALSAVYVCGAVNDQGWKPGPSAIKLATLENGWFKLEVTKSGDFKVSSTVGSHDGDWDGFDTGVSKFNLGSQAINAAYDKASDTGGNSTVPEGTKVIYFSSDLKKAAVSDGTWTPEAYVEVVNPNPDPDPQPSSLKFLADMNASGNWQTYDLEANGTITFTNTSTTYFTFTTTTGDQKWDGAWRPDNGETEISANGTYTANGSAGVFLVKAKGTFTVKPDETAKSFEITGFSGNPNPDPDPQPGENKVSVDVTIPGWTAVKCYYWGGSASAPEWPGVDMTDEGNNVWSITFDNAPANVIFGNGSEQTVDLAYEAGKTYVLRSKDASQQNKWCEEEGGDNPQPGPEPADVKFFRDVNGNWQAFDLANGSYSVTVADGETLYFTFTSDGDWGGAWRPKNPNEGKDYLVSANGTVSANASGSDGCFKITTAGTYVLTPYNDCTFTVSGFGATPVHGLSNTLPVLYINIYQTNADGSFKLDNAGNKMYDNYQLQVEEIDKNYRPGEYWLDMNGCTIIPGENIGSAEEPLPLEMKGRGNWTRKGFAKKPFKLKLGKKQCFLGMGEKSKHWAILAHADDNYGYMRNFTGFNLGKRIGLPWTPSQQPVEVVINGNYRGLYFLTESIRVGDGRVPVEELNDNETNQGLISGGYLVELDNYEEENQIRMEEKSCAPGQMLDVLRITFDTPEEYSELQKRFVTDQFTAMNDLVGKANTNEGNALWSYLDLDDAARYYIVMEICSHTESYHGSTYLFRDRGEGQKWHFSPLWDMGNAFNGDPNGHFFDSDPFGNTWIPSLCLNQKFMDKVRETWLWFMSNKYDGLMADLDAYAQAVTAAAQADKARWDGHATPAGGMSVVDNTDMQGKKQAVVNHLNTKTNWLKNNWGDYTTSLFAEPARDTTPAAALPEYAVTGIEDIAADTTEAPVYYNLQGIRVANPAAGNIYIEVRGNHSRKVMK